MDPKMKPYLFGAIILGAALLLWGPKGLISLLPGPDPK